MGAADEREGGGGGRVGPDAAGRQVVFFGLLAQSKDKSQAELLGKTVGLDMFQLYETAADQVGLPPPCVIDLPFPFAGAAASNSVTASTSVLWSCTCCPIFVPRS